MIEFGSGLFHFDCLCWNHLVCLGSSFLLTSKCWSAGVLDCNLKCQSEILVSLVWHSESLQCANLVNASVSTQAAILELVTAEMLLLALQPLFTSLKAAGQVLGTLTHFCRYLDGCCCAGSKTRSEHLFWKRKSFQKFSYVGSLTLQLLFPRSWHGKHHQF